MFFDTDFNSLQTVLKNIFHSFKEAAMKFHRTVRALTGPRQPNQSFLIKITSDLLELGFVMIQNSCGESRRKVTRTQVRWSVHTRSFINWPKRSGSWKTDSVWYFRLGAQAFKKTLTRKQTKYRELLKWLDDTILKEKVMGMAARVSCLGDDPFQSFRY